MQKEPLHRDARAHPEQVGARPPHPFVVNSQPRESCAAEAEPHIQEPAAEPHFTMGMGCLHTSRERRKGDRTHGERAFTPERRLCGRITVENQSAGAEIPGRPPAVRGTLPDFKESGRRFNAVEFDPMDVAFSRGGEVLCVQKLVPSGTVPDQDAKCSDPIVLSVTSAFVIPQGTAKSDAMQPGRGVKLQCPRMNDPVGGRSGLG